MPWVTVLVSVVAAVLVSPLLAGWTVGLTTDPAHRLGTVVAAPAGRALRGWSSSRLWPRSWPLARPVVTRWSAWWLFAAGGAVLCVVDVEHHLLPARLVYPLAAAVLVALAVTAAVAGEPDRLLRAVLAAAVVGAGWFAVAFLAPSAMGLGDVRVAALAAGLLGWTSWSAVLAGQLAAFGLAAVTAGSSPRPDPASVAGQCRSRWDRRSSSARSSRPGCRTHRPRG